MSQVKFLVQFAISLYKPRSFYSHVLLETIYNASQLATQILGFFHPRESISRQKYWCRFKIQRFPRKYHSLGFAFLWLWISAELNLMLLGILGSNVYHLLEASPGGAEQQKIVCITVSTSIVWSNLAATSGSLQLLEKIVHIKTEDYWREHAPCLTPFLIEKFLEVPFFHRTFANWFL